jgi:hypothetical protein
MIQNEIDKTLFDSWQEFYRAEKKFLDSFKKSSEQCSHRIKTPYRRDVVGREYHGWKCTRKSDPFQWSCEWTTCPVFMRGLKLATGGNS